MKRPPHCGGRVAEFTQSLAGERGSVTAAGLLTKARLFTNSNR